MSIKLSRQWTSGEYTFVVYGRLLYQEERDIGERPFWVPYTGHPGNIAGILAERIHNIEKAFSQFIEQVDTITND
jgi:hypothetical protein